MQKCLAGSFYRHVFIFHLAIYPQRCQYQLLKVPTIKIKRKDPKRKSLYWGYSKFMFSICHKISPIEIKWVEILRNLGNLPHIGNIRWTCFRSLDLCRIYTLVRVTGRTGLPMRGELQNLRGISTYLLCIGDFVGIGVEKNVLQISIGNSNIFLLFYDNYLEVSRYLFLFVIFAKIWSTIMW